MLVIVLLNRYFQSYECGKQKILYPRGLWVLLYKYLRLTLTFRGKTFNYSTELKFFEADV